MVERVEDDGEAQERLYTFLEEVGAVELLHRRERNKLVLFWRRAGFLKKRIEQFAATGKNVSYDQAEEAAIEWIVPQVIIQRAELKRLREDIQRLREENERLRAEKGGSKK